MAASTFENLNVLGKEKSENGLHPRPWSAVLNGSPRHMRLIKVGFRP
jgi:hypothetical protein